MNHPELVHKHPTHLASSVRPVPHVLPACSATGALPLLPVLLALQELPVLPVDSLVARVAPVALVAVDASSLGSGVYFQQMRCLGFMHTTLHDM